MATSYKGYIEIMKLLLSDNRIDLNKRDYNEKTALDWARENGKTKVVELIESFLNNPNETRTKLRIELGFAGKSLNLHFFFNIFFISSSY